MNICKLENIIQEYDWGSPILMPRFLGYENPENKPQAELWMGMHPRAESLVVLGRKKVPLSTVIQEDPKRILGRKTAKIFGGKLPFLFKVLAAGRPLSIQAHPDLEQARKGFERENSAAIPPDARERNYRDDNHKPELMYALTTFYALNGFRSIDEIIVELLAMGSTSLSIEIDTLKSDPTREGLKRFYAQILALDGRRKEEILNEILTSCASFRGIQYRWVEKIARVYPGDMGIISPLLLNCIELKPGQAMFLGPGILHAYLEGLGIEIMANSDNVLRGGLTTKHIDREELLNILTFDTSGPRFLEPEEVSSWEKRFTPPVPEFALSSLEIDEETAYTPVRNGKVEIVICTDGKFTVTEKGAPRSLSLGRGESFIVFGSCPYYTLTGKGTLFRAVVPG